jgi:hypothetical protein
MAENPRWLFVERRRGTLQRVTLLDSDFKVISHHDRGGGGTAAGEPDDCELLRAVELERRAGLLSERRAS